MSRESELEMDHESATTYCKKNYDVDKWVRMVSNFEQHKDKVKTNTKYKHTIIHLKSREVTQFSDLAKCLSEFKMSLREKQNEQFEIKEQLIPNGLETQKNARNVP